MTDLLAKAVKAAITTGNFKLAGGQTSAYYADLRPLLFSQMLRTISERVLNILRNRDCDAIGGPEIASVPITAGVHTLSDYPYRGFVVRKERKDHGTKNLVEGSVKNNDRICVIDDVATSGGSIMNAIRRVEHEKQTICKLAICILDRQEGADEHLRSFGVELVPLFRINTLATMGIG